MDGKGRSGNSPLRIEVAPGHRVLFPGGRSASVEGGTYKLWPRGDAERRRIVAQKGVTVVEESDDASPRAVQALTKHELTLEDAAGMSDEELLALSGIGDAMLAEIRALVDDEES